MLAKTQKFNIIKRSGNKEAFSKIKLINSLKNAGATSKQATSIYNQIGPKIISGMNTRKLYNLAKKYLRKESRRLAIQYSIPKAISNLGPDGYVFEKFIAQIFEAKGYKITLNQTRKGKCVSHELDVCGNKPGYSFYSECKFHNKPGVKNDLKTALYVYARHLDLKKNKQNNYHDFWLISNTKFSKDAVTYANCVGLKLLGPDQPKKKALCDMVIETRVHPITCLSKLKKAHAKFLLARRIITCKELYSKKVILKEILSSENYLEVVKELKYLLGK